jgi:predicted nucleotidyltransferase
MDLSEPATVVMPSGTAAVIRALAGTERAMTTRQLARVAGVSHQRAGQVIARLAAHGLVLTEAQGPSLLCRLNRDHLAAPAVAALAQLRATLLKTLVDEIGSWERAPVHASLFGSAARGDGGLTSDLDVLLVHPDDHDVDLRWADQLSTSGERLRQVTGNCVSWFDLGIADLTRAVQGQESIVQEWQRDAVRLAGTDLTRLLRQAS